MSKPQSFCEYDFDRMEAYNASMLNCYAFRRGTDMVEGHSLALGNMVSGFPFEIEGIRFHNSEATYIAGMFSDGSEAHLILQEALRTNENGFMAKKRIAKTHKSLKRTDWLEFNTQWMLYVVWCKVVSNADFLHLLMALPSEAMIIEDSTFQTGATADVWGTKNKTLRVLTSSYKKVLSLEGRSKAAIKDACDRMRVGDWRKHGIFKGRNVMGKILMACRDAVRNGITPHLDVELLRNKRINLCGRVLDFRDIPNVPGSYAVAC